LSFHKVNNINTEGGGIMALLTWYKLDGNALDSSGNNFHATANNGSYSAGKIESAYLFTNANNSVVSNSDLTINGNISFSVWCRPSDLTTLTEDSATIRGVISNLNHSSFANFSMFVSGARLRVHVGFTDNTRADVVIGATVIQVNTWYHFAMTYNDTTKVLRTYINGVLESQTTLAKQPKFLPQRIILGQWSYSFFNNYEFFGLIDEGRVYNHTLTDMEVQELSRAKMFHYTFDDFQEPTTNYGRMLETVSLSTGLSSSWTIEKLDRDTVKVTALTNNPSFSDFGNITNTLTGTRTIIAGNPVTVSCEIVDFKGSLSRIFPASGGFGTLIGNESSFTQGPAGTYLGRVFRTITHTSNWTHNIQIRVSGAANILAGDYLTIRLTQIEEKAYPTEYVHTFRTGKANDCSGFSYDSLALTEADTPRWIPNAKVGSGAYDFNYVNQDFIRLPNILHDTLAVTISAWVYSNDITRSQNIVSRNGPYFLRIASSRIRVNIYTGTWIFVNGSIPLQSNTWYHLVLTYDGSFIRGYVNGVKDVEAAKTGNMTAFSSNVRIGYTTGGEDAPMDGIIDDVRIYATALSDKDILDLYNTKAEIEQSGVLYARDFLSNAEATVNIATNSFLESGWTGSSELIDSTTKTFRLSQPFPNNSSAWRTYYYNVSNYIGQTITISAFFRVLSETNGNFLDVTVGQGNTGSFPLHIKGSNEIDKFTSTNRNYHFISWTGVINSTGIVGFTVWIHNLVTGALIISELSKVQVEAKPYATPFVSTFRPATSLPTGVQFGADEIHETGIANFEDFSTVGITDGLIGYWPLNGNLIDYSGGNNTLTASTGVSIISGKDGLAYNFNGTSTAFMTVGVDFTPKKAYTKIAWIRTNTASAANIISGSSGEVFYAFGGLLYLSNTWSSPQISASFNYSDGNWHQVVGTYDGTNGRLYADGQLLVTGPLNDLPNGITTFIGRYSTANNFNGDIQYVKIFNRPLTAEEIQIEYNTMFNNQVQIHESGVVYARDLEQY